MGKKKDKQRIIQQTRQQRKADKEMRRKLRKKMTKGDSFKLSQDYLNYYTIFNKEIQPLRIKLKDVNGDGNCLFRAFADQMDGNQDTHLIMRQEACRCMANNQQFFQPFLDQEEDGTFQDYIKTMRKSGEWGGHLQLQALSESFRCLIVIHKKQLQQFNVRPMTQDPTSIVHLGYFQHQDFEHYVSIREINDQSQMPALAALANLNQNMYAFLLYDDPEQFLMRQQFEQMQIAQKAQQMYEYVQQTEPYPNYPRNKKCKCGSKIEYKSCCFKQWQKKRQKQMKY